MAVQGGVFDTITDNATGSGAGSLAFASVTAGTSSMNYSNLTSLSVTSTAANVTINLPAGTQGAVLADSGTPGMETLSATDGSFQSITFADPTGTLTINGTSTAAERVMVRPLNPSFAASLVIDLKGGADEIDFFGPQIPNTTAIAQTVKYVVPTATLSNNGPITFGQTATLSFSSQHEDLSDPSPAFHYAYATTPSFAGVTYATTAGSIATQDFTGLASGTYTFYARIIDQYDAYSQYSTSVIVSRATPVVSWSNPADITYGTALGSTQLNATAFVPGTFAYTVTATNAGASGTVLNAGPNQSLTVTFTPNDTTDYSTVRKSVVINVGQKGLTVTAASKAKTYGDPNPSLDGTLSGVVSGDNITAVYNTSATQYTDVLAGGYAITAALNDPGGRLSNYTVSNTPGTLTINKANQTITWNNPASITYGTALSGTQLNAVVAGVAGGSSTGTVNYTPAAGAVLSPGSPQNLHVDVAATNNYNAASADVLINVTTLQAAGSFVFSAVEGAPSASQTVATFTDPSGPGPLSDYSASIDWGDSSTSPGIITLSGGTFTVTGSHTYAEEGTKTISVAISHDGALNATVTSTASVADAPLHASAAPVNAVEGQPVMNVQVATFIDDNLGGQVGDYAATIDWGDGETSPGSIAASSGGFVVSGSKPHPYAEEGSFSVGVSISDTDGHTSTWSNLAPLPVHVFGLGVAEGVDGRIYAIGGHGASSGTYSNAVFAFTPSTGTWSTVASFPGSGRYDFATATGAMAASMFLVVWMHRSGPRTPHMAYRKSSATQHLKYKPSRRSAS